MMHEQLIRATGGSAGMRDEGLLKSALDAPFQSYGGQDLFPGIHAKAARLGFGIIKNHPMIDGNKRLGTHAMLTFLTLNGVRLQYTQKELYEEILKIASGYVQSYNCAHQKRTQAAWLLQRSLHFVGKAL